ncbi:TadE/TadG family type IV pilus assembly protein [Altererythrobacter sp. GH1-8]|uniref:TadE/TadG family type IV pilus assembly protein n=1 Tax=Altererythrobacter sp. GH1-8 TaxID=3349333 RepID=UPI00374CE39C
MRMFLSSLLRDERGMAAEFALVLPLLLIFVIGAIDVGYYAWNINQAEKATQVGARFAAVTDPIATEIATASYVNVTVGTNLVTQGDRIPVGALGQLTCISTGCTCTTGPCPGTTFNSAAFGRLADRMQNVWPRIADEDIQVTYSGSGLGYAGNPNGPDISPIITVRLLDMEYTPLTFTPFGGNVDLPDFSYSLTAEDNAGELSN